MIKNLAIFLKFSAFHNFTKWHNSGLRFQIPLKFHKYKEFIELNIPGNLMKQSNRHFLGYITIYPPAETVTWQIYKYIFQNCNIKNSNYYDDRNSLYKNVTKFPGFDGIFY